MVGVRYCNMFCCFEFFPSIWLPIERPLAVSSVAPRRVVPGQQLRVLAAVVVVVAVQRFQLPVAEVADFAAAAVVSDAAVETAVRSFVAPVAVVVVGEVVDSVVHYY